MQTERRAGFWSKGIFFGCAALLAFAAGCVGGSKGGLSSDDKERLKPYILDQAPADIPHKLDVNFENKIRLLGYKFEPELAKPGTDVKLTYWWRCDEQLDEGWGVFTHLRDDASDRSDNLEQPAVGDQL